MNSQDTTKYRVWFTPNPPRKAFTVPCDSLEHAIFADAILSGYSLYLGEELIDVSVGGIQAWNADDNDWEDIEATDNWDADAAYEITSRLLASFGPDARKEAARP